jgi:NADH dehydrogenase FAD-containing subunit
MPPICSAGAAPRNIVVVGANFAGYHAARIIALELPPDSPYQVVVVEPNSHFNFTWVLPRFCVVGGGHEHKAFVPYGPYLGGAPARWVRDRVCEVGKGSVRLEGSGEEIPYEFLVIATGSGAGDSLPSRVGVTDKVEGTRLLREMQRRVKEAGRLLVVGGGAAGVELAADAKSLYPEKKVTLVHSRDAVMHRFGRELQEEALRSLTSLGVEVILGDRVAGEDEDAGIATLTSGRTVEYDYIVSPISQPSLRSPIPCVWR